ncbi:platelet-derived growth factor receptor beta-like [Plectropomus leopardus]|uniref:platelet-derived growth factor receptor beta-like n=1 Tax=Plectropomus leopardus TaxID=160734 RepID=UPI001C4B2779|nr:platelet-derived growth factor receptor beta-like [Plectropomus leopardus]
MRRCWEEDPQDRPSFSSLIVSVGNMLTDEYKKHYVQLTEDFLRGEHPAVVGSRLTPSRDQTDRQTYTNESPAPRMLEAGPEEAGPSHGTYIIPVSDITIETSGEAALDAVRYRW